MIVVLRKTNQAAVILILCIRQDTYMGGFLCRVFQLYRTNIDQNGILCMQLGVIYCHVDLFRLHLFAAPIVLFRIH